MTQVSALSQNGYGLIQHKTFSGSPLQGHARGYAGVKNSPVSRPHLAFSLSLKQPARTFGLERRFREASLHLSPLLTANTLVRALGPLFLPTPRHHDRHHDYHTVHITSTLLYSPPVSRPDAPRG
jgi:hypothetical protein